MNKPHIIDRYRVTALQSLNPSESLLQSTNLIARFRENCELIKKDTRDDVLLLECCRKACEHAMTEFNMRRASRIFKDDMWTTFGAESDRESPDTLPRLVKLLIRLYPVARLALGSSSDVVCSLFN